MNTISNHLSTSMYSGRVLLASVMLVIVLITASYVGYSNAPKVPADKPKVGVVRAIVYNPPNSCAMVDKDLVHVGGAINDILVVAIQNDSVEFSKAGLTWQQEVLETPHKAWKQ